MEKKQVQCLLKAAMPRKKLQHEVLIVCSCLFVIEIPVAAPTATYSSSEEPTGEFKITETYFQESICYNFKFTGIFVASSSIYGKIS